MVYGIWYMVYGIWYMVYGIGYVVYGIWYMQILILKFIFLAARDTFRLYKFIHTINILLFYKFSVKNPGNLANLVKIVVQKLMIMNIPYLRHGCIIALHNSTYIQSLQDETPYPLSVAVIIRCL